MPLEHHYSGDGAFEAMARLLESEWEENALTAELLHRMDGDLSLAVVIYGTLLSESLNWLDRPIPALNGSTPLQCLTSDKGKRRLKECLLRFPR